MALIFRPIRTILLLMFAFVAGLLYERFNTSEACAKAGGEMRTNICIGTKP